MLMISLFAALLPRRTHHPVVHAHHRRATLVAAGPGRRQSHDASPGDVRLRCLTPTDAHHVRDLLDRMSPHSRYQRYFRPVRSFGRADIARFVAADPTHLAVGAFDGGDLVGLAQYFRLARCPEQAEVAVEVADSHHRRRVGARLVHELARQAARQGITHFTATVLAENRPVLGLMQHSGWDIATTFDGPYADVVVTLPAELRCPATGGGPAAPRSPLVAPHHDAVTASCRPAGTRRVSPGSTGPPRR